MGAAFYVVLQEPNTEAQAIIEAMTGKALSQSTERLEDIAERLGVTPLMQFFSEDPTKLAAALMSGDDDEEDEDEEDEGAQAAGREEPTNVAAAPTMRTAAADPSGGQAGDKEGAEAAAEGDDGEADDGAVHFVEDWFDATEGLKTVKALIEHIQFEPDAVDNADHLLAELAAIEKVLEIAEKAKTGFHVAIDF